jgi:uncharacterized protein
MRSMRLFIGYSCCMAAIAYAFLALPTGAAETAAKSGEVTPQTGSPGDDRFGTRPADIAYGAFQRGLYITALNLALPEAEKGDRAAQMLVAEIHARGLGVPRNPDEATKWYMAAAEQGEPEAQLQAAMILLGDKPLDRENANRTEAIAMLKASAGSGNAFAAFNLAQILIADQPGEPGLREAAPLFTLAADKGIGGAHFALSELYRNGAGGLPLDSTKSEFHLREAAKSGLDTAQLDLGTALVDGAFGKRNYAEGQLWLRQAANQGNALAQIRLAKVYVNGLGIDPDPTEAGALYIRAKRSGLTDLELDDYMEGLADDERAAALARANEIRR